MSDDHIPGPGENQLSRSGVRGFSGAQLRRLRERHGLTVDDLAGKAGVSRQAVSTWETGKVLPTPPLLLRVAKALGITVADLAPVPTNELRLSDLRVQVGLTQVDAADKLGISATLLVDTERGRKPYNADRAAKLAELYRVDVEQVEACWLRVIETRAARLRHL